MNNNVVQLDVDSASKKVNEVKAEAQTLFDNPIDYASMSDEAVRGAGIVIGTNLMKARRLLKEIETIVNLCEIEKERYREACQLTLLEFTDKDGSKYVTQVSKKTLKKVNRSKVDSYTGFSQTITSTVPGIYIPCSRTSLKKVEEAVSNGTLPDDSVETTTIEQVLLDLDWSDTNKGGK